MHSGCLQTRGSSEFRKKTSFQHKFRNGLLDNSSSSDLSKTTSSHVREEGERRASEHGGLACQFVSFACRPFAKCRMGAGLET